MCPKKVIVGGGRLSDGGRKGYFTKLGVFQELGVDYRNKPKTDSQGESWDVGPEERLDWEWWAEVSKSSCRGKREALQSGVPENFPIDSRGLGEG